KRYPHNVKHLAWCLWWTRYAIPTKYVRQVLLQAAVDWEQWLTEMREREDGAEADDADETDELPDAAWDVIDKSPDLRMRRKLIRQIRKRVTRERFPTIARLILEYGSGRFTGYPVDPVTDSKEDAQHLIERTVGLHSPQAARLIREWPEFHEVIEAGY